MIYVTLPERLRTKSKFNIQIQLEIHKDSIKFVYVTKIFKTYALETF